MSLLLIQLILIVVIGLDLRILSPRVFTMMVLMALVTNAVEALDPVPSREQKDKTVRLTMTRA